MVGILRQGLWRVSARWTSRGFWYSRKPVSITKLAYTRVDPEHSSLLLLLDCYWAPRYAVFLLSTNFLKSWCWFQIELNVPLAAFQALCLDRLDTLRFVNCCSNNLYALGKGRRRRTQRISVINVITLTPT